jgi:hypothetical protein
MSSLGSVLGSVRQSSNEPPTSSVAAMLLPFPWSLIVRLFGVLLFALALASPTLAQTPPVDGTSMAASAKDAAAQLQVYLDKAAKSGGRPDFTKPPASDLFSRIFDFGKLAALPAPSARDLPWVLAWASAADQASKAIVFFGITPTADPYNAALQRNMVEFEDQEVLASTFTVRIIAREGQAAFLFTDPLTPEKRTPDIEQGLTKIRAGSAMLIDGALMRLTSGVLKPANERLLSAAIADTVDVWVKAILSKDRTNVLRWAAKAQSTVKDSETRRNLAVFSAAMAAAK